MDRTQADSRDLPVQRAARGKGEVDPSVLGSWEVTTNVNTSSCHEASDKASYRLSAVGRCW